MGAPHFHLRRAWPCKDEETGLTTSNQTQALLKAGILPSDPEKNIDVLEEISKWDEHLDPIVDLFVAAFANSNKAIKDGHDSQIKQYDHMLNGYTKQTANGKKHFFGAAEISQMFESATPKLLRKIAGVIAEHGCKDVKEWMQKSPWYREFELGRDVERKLRIEREWER